MNVISDIHNDEHVNIKSINFFVSFMFHTLQSNAFSSPNYKPSSIKTRGKIETIDDEQDPDLIPQYPRLTNIHHEMIPLNSDSSFLNRGEQRLKHPANDFLTDVEINFQLTMMNGGKVPESCVWVSLWFFIFFFAFLCFPPCRTFISVRFNTTMWDKFLFRIIRT